MADNKKDIETPKAKVVATEAVCFTKQDDGHLVETRYKDDKVKSRRVNLK